MKDQQTQANDAIAKVNGDKSPEKNAATVAVVSGDTISYYTQEEFKTFAREVVDGKHTLPEGAQAVMLKEGKTDKAGAINKEELEAILATEKARSGLKELWEKEPKEKKPVAVVAILDPDGSIAHSHVYDDMQKARAAVAEGKGITDEAGKPIAIKHDQRLVAVSYDDKGNPSKGLSAEGEEAHKELAKKQEEQAKKGNGWDQLFERLMGMGEMGMVLAVVMAIFTGLGREREEKAGSAKEGTGEEIVGLREDSSAPAREAAKKVDPSTLTIPGMPSVLKHDATPGAADTLQVAGKSSEEIAAFVAHSRGDTSPENVAALTNQIAKMDLSKPISIDIDPPARTPAVATAPAAPAASRG